MDVLLVAFLLFHEIIEYKSIIVYWIAVKMASTTELEGRVMCAALEWESIAAMTCTDPGQVTLVYKAEIATDK